MLASTRVYHPSKLTEHFEISALLLDIRASDVTNILLYCVVVLFNPLKPELNPIC